MMTIHKLTAGDGYTYLTRHIAGGDVQRGRGQEATDYYTAKGNPPGYWLGRGSPELGLAGQQVTEEQMRQLFGSGMHPNAEAIIAAYLAKHVTADMSDTQLEKARAEAVQAATLGNPFPEYQPLQRFDHRVSARLAAIEAETRRPATDVETSKIKAEEARRARTAVAGFDVVFSPVKSAALLWALDERTEVRATVREAHEAARDSALALLEEHAALTRTGKGGIAQIETKGLIAAVFEHRDSRAGDPNLHSHVVVSSKVQGVDGKWRALDARPLYRMTVAASEHYNTRFETELVERLAQRGYSAEFTERPDTIGTREPIREIAGVDPKFIDHFSSRRTQIEARYDQLLRQFRREHGYDPSRQVCHQLARQANLDTRDEKGTVRSLEEMRSDWKQSLAETFGRRAVKQLMSAVSAQAVDKVAKTEEPLDIEQAARRVIAGIETSRSTWTIWNVRAEAERFVRLAEGIPTRQQHDQLVSAIVTEAVSPRHSIKISAPELVPEPKSLQRTNGESVFAEHAAGRFTSAHIMAAEERLVVASRTQTAVGLSAPAVVAALDGFESRGTILDPGQRNLVTAFATDPRLLVLGLGPAGSGKTTAMRAYAHVTAQAGQRVVPLATSAVAADVLARDMSIPAENLHKFLWEYGPTGSQAANLHAGKPVPAWASKFALSPGDVVLVDEAGMAGTLALDELMTIAAARGAVVRLLGDFHQLGAVESGGALRLIANETGAVELSTLYRFHDPAEAAATLKLREGDATALDFYADNGRIRSGSIQAMTEAAYAGWKRDMLAGKTSLMAAATSTNVTALAAQARIDRVEAGQVETGGVTLHDGNLAGVGDWITTRKNNRELRASGGRDWVKNGDAWQVAKQHRDGSLTVRHLDSAAKVRLPAGYIARSVELLYATTTNRAQGTTVDTAHPLITPEMSRENLYVIASRARSKTTLYVATHELLAFDPDDRVDRVKNDPRMYAAREVVTQILGREGNEHSATEMIREVQQQAESLATLAPRFQYAQEIAVRPAYRRIVFGTFEEKLAVQITDSPSYAMLRRALLAAEQSGRNPALVLDHAANAEGLMTNSPNANCTTPGEEADGFTERLTEHITAQTTGQLASGARHPAGGESAIPVWLRVVPSANEAIDDDMPTYLRQLSSTICARAHELATETIEQRPRWLRVLSGEPEQPDAAEEWRRNIATICAYREQFAVTDDDPRQVLGAHPDADQYARTAHHLAAESVAAAHRLEERELHREVAVAAAPYSGHRLLPTTATLAEECKQTTNTREDQPLEISLAERRRAAREAERTARRERVLQRQHGAQHDRRLDHTTSVQPHQAQGQQFDPSLLQPQVQKIEQQERQMGM